MNEISTSKQKSKFWKLGNKYFLPPEIYDYLNISIFVFFFVLFGISTTHFKIYNILILFFWFILIFIYIKDRLFIEIKTANNQENNIKLIEDLALRQQNVSTSLEQKGLFIFEYLERNIFYKYNFRKRDYIETVIIFCEDNSIFVNSYNYRYFGFVRRYNLKQLIKLIKIKTK